MKLSRKLLAVAILSTAVAGVGAQTAGPPRRIVPRGAAQAFGFGPAGTIISAKAGAPFSAVLVEEMQNTLSDGTNIDRKIEEVVMRDSAGRLYRARTIKKVGSGESRATSRMMVTISDPVLHVQYVCPPIRICRKMGYRIWPKGRGPQRGPFLPPLHGDRNVKEEDLGTSGISGVTVVGKRMIRVIPEGMAGNDRPFETVQEVWHSDELDVDVQVKQIDPRYGTRTTTMTEINQGEPDPSYFQIPQGYRVEKDRVSAQPQVDPQPQPNQ